MSLDRNFTGTAGQHFGESSAPVGSNSASAPTAQEPLDLLVIGAGPHALSLLTRLIDDEPDLMSEAERIHLMQRARARSHAEVRHHLLKRFDLKSKVRVGTGSSASNSIHNSTLVIDTHGRWMAQWAADFEAFGIEFLRSHEYLHPDPYDFQSLTVWAKMRNRGSELKQMNCVDRRDCHRVGFKGPFVTPGSRLFLDFCADLVARYGLEQIVRKGTVEEIQILPPQPCSGEGPHSVKAGKGSDPQPETGKNDQMSLTQRHLLEVVLSDGRRFIARWVVCAMGPGPAFQGMHATLPWWAEELECALGGGQIHETHPLDSSVDHSAGVTLEGEICSEHRLQHSSTLSKWLLQTEAKNVLQNRRVLIVGGGQTSAHLVHVAIARGASAVTLCSRKRICRKPFDVDASFVGFLRPNMLQQFWQLEDFRARKQFNAALRNGGSMSGEAYADLAARVGERLDLAEENEVVQAHWCPLTEKIQVRLEDGRLSSFDFVWLATGGNFDLELVPVLASLKRQAPIPCVGSLPQLQGDLRWAAGLPVYVMGAFAQLQLGADALNLAGARAGGVVVARALLRDGLGSD
uniref:Uncharacterized protein n=1 Tax=Chromera velia CCMP2878 TaxID=1169474 RepID=A0A0G4HAD6_9ALVE|eukprot:Cvel_6087.t1-p1 / transcript=Cvel_6087.t1 / gene=Cvel_6087 / organism=Chromera_velia_CCMP2878 / gene_product=hypothetical protein / transcript_product=hypothetical protein / location=Cvel_scaffold293:41571-43439(+) / protein_length=575 / sequence_SO=supercontig / SO=protein_coding / is_pseudo=false